MLLQTPAALRALNDQMNSWRYYVLDRVLFLCSACDSSLTRLSLQIESARVQVVDGRNYEIVADFKESYDCTKKISEEAALKVRSFDAR